MGSFSTSTATTGSVGPMVIAGRNKYTTRFDMGANADIALVRVYGDVLTDAEVLQNFNAGLVIETPAIIPAGRI